MRYRLALLRGESPAAARASVAVSYGLNANVVRLGSDGTEKVVTITWTIEQIARLLFIQHLYRTGLLTEQ